ncbi:MAG: hypothetical protein GF401_13975 [Chitinivibrionales bacterium]|nr:hypothetical protein [Chitinivibrionales bacterium]
MREKRFTYVSEAKDLDLAPFLNLMIVLVPVLLLSVEFARISIIDAALLSCAGSNTKEADTVSDNREEVEKLLLTAIISDSSLVLASRQGVLPDIMYREYHEYIAQDDGQVVITEYYPDKKVVHPVTKREMKLVERNEIRLYSIDEKGNIIRALYTGDNDLVTDKEGNIIHHPMKSRDTSKNTVDA